jgi:colicin import membrane protein
MTTTPTTIDTTAIVATPELTPLDRFEALALRIASAEQEAFVKQFDYRDKYDNKRARSWIYELRQIKGSIERARKEAKAVHLERGRAVDEQAKLLEASVQGLIEPHQSAIDEIEAEEQARIDGHKAVLERIAALVEGVTTSEEAQARLTELQAIDTTTLEEFAAAGANRQAEIGSRLQLAHEILLAQERERAELEALRAEKAAREEAERIERIRQEAIEAERRAAAEAAQRAEAERQAREAAEAERRAREAAEAERRQQEALAAAELARQAQELAERREREALAAAEAARQAEVDRQAAEALRQQQAEEARAQRLESFRGELKAAMKGRTAAAVIEAIIAGSLHPAIAVDWSKV